MRWDTGEVSTVRADSLDLVPVPTCPPGWLEKFRESVEVQRGPEPQVTEYDLAAPDAEEYRWLNEWDGEESPAEEVQRQADSGDPGSTEG